MTASAENNVIRFLHLTDLHVGQPKEASRYGNIEAAFLADLERQAQAGWRWDVVFFTGDLAFRGRLEELAVATLRLKRILDRVAELNARGGAAADHYPHFFPVPGNHDLDRPKPEQLKTLQHRWTDPLFRRDFWNDPGNPLRQEVRRSFTAYERWLELLPRPSSWVNGVLPGDFSANVAVDGISLGIVGLNGTFLHFGDDAFGKQAVDLSQLTRVVGPDPTAWARAHDFNLLLTHHPADWFDAEARKQLETEIQQHDRFDLHLFGHMHAGAHLARVAPRGFRHLVMGRSLFGAEEEGFDRMHGYAMGKLILEPPAKSAGGDGTGGSDGIGAPAEPRTRRLELWPREAVCRPDGGWTFGDEVHAGVQSWHIHAPLGSATKGIVSTGVSTVKAQAFPSPKVLDSIEHSTFEPSKALAGLLREKALFLSASVPYKRTDARAEAEQALVQSARQEVILEAVQLLALRAREAKLQLVFGGHPSIAAALLPVAQTCWREGWPWLLFFQHVYFKHRQEELARALSLFSGVQLIWVSGEAEALECRPGAREEQALREVMLKLPGLAAGVFVGGLTGVKREYELTGTRRPELQRYTFGCGGGMAAKLLLEDPSNARGQLEDSGPLWSDAASAVKAVMTGHGVQGVMP